MESKIYEKNVKKSRKIGYERRRSIRPCLHIFRDRSTTSEAICVLFYKSSTALLVVKKPAIKSCKVSKYFICKYKVTYWCFERSCVVPHSYKVTEPFRGFMMEGAGSF